MPKPSTKLLTSDRQIRAAKTTGQRTDFRIAGVAGLQLRVTAAGTKTWNLAYKSPATGKWAKIAFGRYPAISLFEARQHALLLSGQVSQGIDPLKHRNSEQPRLTFHDLSRLYLNEHANRNRRNSGISTSTKEAQRILAKDIWPRIGHVLADQVDRSMVVDIVQSVADRKALVASDRALGLLRAIYNWGRGTGKLNNDPTLGLKKRNASRPRTRILDLDEVKIFWAALDGHLSMTDSIRDALKLQLLTGLRIGEILGARLKEIDFDHHTWTIPADRTKSNRIHTLPLSDPATEILETIKSRVNELEQRSAFENGYLEVQNHWLFPSTVKGQPIDAHAATRAVLRNRPTLISLGIVEPFNTHDLRRTCATHLAELGTSEDVIARILNHAPISITGRHYNHARQLGAMQEALQRWGSHLMCAVSHPLSRNNRSAIPNSIKQPSIEYSHVS